MKYLTYLCIMNHIVQLTLTYGRATLLSRALYAYLQQDYEGKSTMLIFNTGKPYQLNLGELPPNKEVILINSDKEYNSVGEKYIEAIKYIPEDCTDIVCLDEDDFYVSDGLKRGYEGLQKSGKSAYKSAKSYFHFQGKITEEGNNLEGSIFMKIGHLRKYGFHTEYSVKYHDAWLHPLLQNKDIEIDENCKPYFVYDWHTMVPTYKMSGLGETGANFQNSQLISNDFGNGILIPESLNYHKIIEKCQFMAMYDQ